MHYEQTARLDERQEAKACSGNQREGRLGRERRSEVQCKCEQIGPNIASFPLKGLIAQV